MVVKTMTVSNHAGDLAALLPVVQRAARGIVGVRIGEYEVQETVPGTFRVVNAHTGRDYAVQYYEGSGVWTCDCPDFKGRHLPLCKHIALVVWGSGLVNEHGVPRSCEPPF
ncbi:MAG TPA: SWIM zinc finger family protein [Thermoflexia bacterium]|nr:SWIM zinc finger family protein [Thermoflexia bacterium]